MRPGGLPVAVILASACLLLQVFGAEDIYWEGEEDASNEFLEVKSEDTGILGRLSRMKRAGIFDIFSSFTSTTTTTTEASDSLYATDDPDAEKGPDEGSGAPDHAEEPGEKTLRVTFVVMEPYSAAYSNRDSQEFQNFSKTIGDAVDQLYKNIPGEQKATLVRIQSRVSDEFSCKVTLDIGTTNFDDLNRIGKILRDHIKSRRELGSGDTFVKVSDVDFTTTDVNQNKSCSENEITCSDNTCVPRSNRCDGVNDCIEGEDELNCDIVGEDFQYNGTTTPKSDCEPFVCAQSAATICKYQLCDGQPDCPNADDEDNCEGEEEEEVVTEIINPIGSTEPALPFNCPEGEFACDDTRCVSLNLRCDKRPDCYDGTDEKGCPDLESCGVDDFRCPSNGKCIEQSRRCDLVVDCPNEEDEQNCDCREGDFQCISDRSCIEGRKRCDGINHCRDSSDEQDCHSQLPDWWANYVCQDSGRFRCHDGTCISILLRCDGFRDCAKDGSDEIGCPCGPDQWQCDFGNCIKRNKRCDGHVDCPTDRSDERNCFDIGKFRCRTGTLIPDYLRCNRLYDCPPGDYSDEQNCPCGDGDFKCDNGNCIPSYKHCDRTHDCQDKSDERDCIYGTVCMAFEYKCTSGQCIPAEAKCNGTRECSDSSDEHNCPCKRDQFPCRNGSCISLALRCDGHRDCPSAEDELNCASHNTCPPDAFTCNVGSSVPCARRCDDRAECDDAEDEENCDETACSHFCDGICLEDQKICNGVPDCSDDSDELNCDHCDRSDDFRCKNGECININLRCNGVFDCSDDSDELDCPFITTSRPDQCTIDEFQCDDGSCINKEFRCDGRTDCLDNSDEVDCRCDESQWRCTSGACISKTLYCDGVADCNDNSDEIGCPTTRPWFTTTYNPLPTPPPTASPTAGYPNGNYGQGRPSSSRPDEGFNRPDQNAGNDNRPGGGSGRPDDGFYRPDQNGGNDNRPGGGSGRPDDSYYRPDLNGGNDIRPGGGSGRPDDGYYRPDLNGGNDIRPGGGSGRPDDGYYRPDLNGGNDNRPGGGSGRPDDGYYRPDLNGGNDIRPGGGSGRPDDGYYRPDLNGGNDNRPGGVSGRPDYGYYRPDLNGGNDNRPGGVSGRPDDGYYRPDLNGGNDNRPGGVSGRPDDGYYRPDLNGGNDNRPGGGSGRPDDGYYRPDLNGGNDNRPEGSYYQPGQNKGQRPDYETNEIDNDRNPQNAGAVRPNQGCDRNQWRCENGPCIESRQRCDGRVDCPLDSSDEFDCPAGSPTALLLKTYPNTQTVRYGGDVVFQCRDEGPIRAPVRWVREGGRNLKVGSTDRNGRLELNQVTPADSGVYICQAVGYLGQPNAELKVTLNVDTTPVTQRPPEVSCRRDEATCANGQCIPKSGLCNGVIDCSDRSDEEACHVNGKCEPNQFMCTNKKCILKTWRCDSEDDCGDGSDEVGCAPSLPGQCKSVEFTCSSGGQCVPKSFHCDGQSDCFDGSDEIGCGPVHVTSPPHPSNVQLNVNETLRLNCSAQGTPTPFISWRRNWGEVPEVCTSENIMSNGQVIGVLVCPNMQPEYNGAYSCEVMNNKGTHFAVPDAIVIVKKTDVCPSGYFNKDARSERECIRCFCFGESTSCHSADLFTYNMPTPLGQGGTRLVGVKNTGTGDVQLDNSAIVNQYYYQPLRNGATVTKLARFGANRGSSSVLPYLTLPETYNGNQLTSYGGHIKYRLAPHSPSYGSNYALPDIIIKGKYQNLVYFNRGNPSAVEARLVPENWEKPSPRGLVPATREDIMMALDNIEMILLRSSINNAGVNITDFVMESAHHIDAGLGDANLVEECVCPPGYEGLSCQKCASGYARERSGRWLGDCVPERPQCPPGTYGDPNSGYACRPCPCPLTNRENQFARTCAIGPDGQVACDCNPGYEGRNCEYCAPGYVGNPLVVGDSCQQRPTDNCNTIGTSHVRLPDECSCKDNVQGRYCDQCKNDSFYLSNDFRGGCALCFCSGVSQQCRSSDLRRKTTTVRFNTPSIVNQVKVYSSTPLGSAAAVRYNAPVETNLTATYGREEVLLTNYDRSRPAIYYWSLPIAFAGDKVTSYGGHLRYTLRNVPQAYDTRSYGDSSSKNNAADVLLISENHLTFHFFGNFDPASDGTLDASVQFLEKGWQRPDGKDVSREHFLLALADVKAILVKALYSSGAQLASLVSASIDTAEKSGNGPAALHVEQCVCSKEYIGTSCEDCAPGYTRKESGLYLEHCGLCECNGHSKMCHAETGVCTDCQDNTEGDSCERCKPGYRRDPYNNCVPESPTLDCHCDPRGSSGPCDENGYCACKLNVEGPNCDTCRRGTFGLDASNPAGCYACYCSGATTDCHDASSQYIRVEMAAPVLGPNNGGYKLMDVNAQRVISDQIVAMPIDSELMYVFTFPPNEELYWSLPEFPGNRILSYGGNLQLKQRFESSTNTVSEPGTDVILVSDDKSLYWTNPQAISAGQVLDYKVPLSEQGWYLLNYGTPASRSDFLSVLKNLRRVLVRATLVRNIDSTFIADVSMDTAVDMYDPARAPATGVEICMCPEGYSGTSCESCTPGYYRDQYGCQRCNCNGHDCYVGANNQVTCNCRPPYTGNDCSILGDSNKVDNGTTRPPPQRPSVVVKITSPTIKIQDIGSSVNFTCQAQSRMSSNLPVQWSKDNGYLPQGRTQFDNRLGMLIITNLQTSDSGKYICQTSDGISTAQAIATLRVPGNDMTQPTVEIQPPINEYFEGDRIQLECIASGNPSPTITWQRSGGRPLPQYAEVIEELFIIENAREEDSGEYRCRVSNAVGNVDRTAVVTVRPRPSQPSRDKLTVSQSSPTISEGQNTRVVCTGTANVPAGTIDWIRQDGGLLSNNVRSDNGILYIDYARLENQGVYICQTSSYNVQPVLVVVTVIPQGTPSPEERSNITVSKEKLRIPTGGSGTVDCNPTGNPLPLVKWRKYDGQLGEGTSQRQNTLIITNAREDDQGYYLCEGTVDGQPVASIYVFVEIEKRERPEIAIWPEGEQAVTLGSPFELRCRILAGFPDPTVTWDRAGGRPLSRFAEIQPNNILKFERIEVNDEGEYSCTATNLAGTASASSIIKVRSAPEIAILPSNYITVVNGDPVNVECHASGHPEPLVSIKTSPDLRVIVAPLPGVAVLRIPSATDMDEGDYICSASSAAGTIEEQFGIRVDRGDGGFGNEDEGSGEDFGTYPQEGYDQNQPSDVIAIEGGLTRIECDSPEDLSVQWTRADRRPLQPNAEQQGSSLIIRGTSKQDSGQYVCNLFDRYTRELTRSATTSLVVMAQPRITLQPPTQIVHPGESPIVECIVTGDEIEEINWRPITKPFSSRVELRSSTLIFNRIEVEDAGKYECFARNRVANTSATAEVIVSEETDRAPSESHDNEQRAHVGAAVHLSCNVQASPLGYSITWTKNGRQIPHSIVQRRDGSLYIRLAQKSDSGHYVCNIEDRYGRRTSNYINLHIDGDEDCQATDFRCYDRTGCVSTNLLCDGVRDCPDNSDEENCILPERRIRDSPGQFENFGAEEPQSIVSIDQPRRPYRVGENVEVMCRARSRADRVSWERYGTRQYVDQRVFGDGAVLLLNNVQESDAGRYRCTGTDPYRRTSYDDINLEVIPGNPVAWPSNPSAELQQYTARQGDTIDMPCNHNLEQPVSIEWRKEYIPLRPEARAYDQTLHLERITEADAGTYVCRVSNSRTVVESRSVLRVAGVVPRFDSTGWISLPTLQEAYRQFDIEISFKPIDGNGLILYNSGNSDGTGDYLALQLVNGAPLFVMDAGSGPIYVTGDRPLQLNEWHTVRISKTDSKVVMDVDNNGPTSVPTSSYQLLELKAPLYIGGLPDYRQLPAALAATSATGFVGCVSMLVLGNKEKNIMLDRIDASGILECDSCNPNLCNQNSVCQEARNERGYSCLCAEGFAGLNCDRTGEGCKPDLCGPGKCTDAPDGGYSCACPVTYTGKNCEKKQYIEYPAFTGSAYLAIKAPQASRYFRMSMKVKPAAPVTDGIIMYYAESARGYGGFTALTVHNESLEFIYDLGDESRPVVLTANKTLPANEWTDVQIVRVGTKVTLLVNFVHGFEDKLESNRSSIKFETPMFVGGAGDDSIVLNKNIGVSGGFRGCIKDVTVYGMTVDIVGTSIQSANVQECSSYNDRNSRGDIPEVENICSQCRNGGQCTEDGTGCECPSGFTGQFCETRVPLLNRRRPNVDPCALQPCRNGGTCRRDLSNPMNYTCDCKLGFAGTTCQMVLELRQSVAFNGNGYIELPANRLRYDEDDHEPVMIAMAFYTNTDGVLLYQREVAARPNSGDFILIRIENGFIVMEWDLGGGFTSLTIQDVYVADLNRHAVIAKLNEDGSVSLTVDGITKNATSTGFTSVMNADSNIYVGGIPDRLNVNQWPGLSGCVEQIELMESDRGINLGLEAVAGRNTQRCRNYGA